MLSSIAVDASLTVYRLTAHTKVHLLTIRPDYVYRHVHQIQITILTIQQEDVYIIVLDCL